jgi:hypothetical protein
MILSVLKQPYLQFGLKPIVRGDLPGLSVRAPASRYAS